MIINDLTMLSTQLEVWKAYLKLDVTPDKYQLQMELNTLLLKNITPDTLLELREFIARLEKLVQP